MRHPSESELALLGGGDSDFLARFILKRHVRDCRQCTETVARFEMLRAGIMHPDPPDLDWRRLEAEMRANIRLGLEAGECVRQVPAARSLNPRLAVAFASLIILAGAGLMMRQEPATVKAAEPVLELSGAGLELRKGASSMTLMNRNGSVADQTVSAEGEIGARYVDAGSVTINNVYLE